MIRLERNRDARFGPDTVKGVNKRGITEVDLPSRWLVDWTPAFVDDRVRELTACEQAAIDVLVEPLSLTLAGCSRTSKIFSMSFLTCEWIELQLRVQYCHL